MIRPAGPQDARFLRDMLRHAYYWRMSESGDLPVARYVLNWGRPGYEALSLSVAKDSPAVSLYERYGFRTVAEPDDALTMVAKLD